MKLATHTAVIFAACFAASAAYAQNILESSDSFVTTGMTIAEVAVVMKRNGVTFETTGLTTANGDEFLVEGYNCESERCTEYLLIIGFDLPNGLPMATVNEWNATALCGRAFLDEENDPWLDHVISVRGPGDAGAFEEGLVLWLGALNDFNEELEAYLSAV